MSINKHQSESGVLEFYTTIENRFKTHYLDMDVKPASEYTYMFKTYSDDAEAKRGQSIVVHTLPVLNSVSWIHSVTGMPRTAKIIWRPHSNKKVKYYTVERKTLEDTEWQKLANVEGRLSAEYIDSDLKDNYIYMYRVRVVTYDDIVSKPSASVKVITKALPQSIESIKATKKLPHVIKITWKKSTQKDFKRYYLYRSSSIDGTYELIAKLYNNHFVDEINEDAKSYFYRVSAVDVDGLESEHEERSVQGSTLAKPSSPVIVESKYLNDEILLRWKKGDSRAVKYIVTRKEKKGWFDESSKDFINITATSFRDKKIEPDSTYKYVVYAVDKNGIKSEASLEVKIVTPESLEGTVESKSTTQKQSIQNSTVESKDIITPTEDLDLSGL
jgi:fibronectin type 3 domain-containing protein